MAVGARTPRSCGRGSSAGSAPVRRATCAAPSGSGLRGRAPERRSPVTARPPPPTGRAAAQGYRRRPTRTPNWGRRPNRWRRTGRVVASVKPALEPARLDQRHVLQQTSEGQRRRRYLQGEARRVDASTLPSERGALVLEEPEEGRELVPHDRGLGATLLVDVGHGGESIDGVDVAGAGTLRRRACCHRFRLRRDDGRHGDGRVRSGAARVRRLWPRPRT